MRARFDEISDPLLFENIMRVNYLGAAPCRRKFELFYPDGFQDETYLIAERAHKERAHLEWHAELGPADFRKLLARGEFRRDFSDTPFFPSRGAAHASITARKEVSKRVSKVPRASVLP